MQDAISLCVLVVVREAIDIALHIASDEGWELAATYRESFAVLARHGVIDDTLAAPLASAAQLRDRIASFEAFSSAISAFLVRTPPA